MPTYLDAPFKDKDKVKALGARWDAAEKRWFVPDGKALEPFATWLPATAGMAALATAEDNAAPRASTSTAMVADPGSSTALTEASAQGHALSVYLGAIQAVVAHAFAEPAWVRVEVFAANIRNGHVYLDVGERTMDGQELAKARMTIWRNRAEAILPAFQKATGMVLGEGMKLLVQVLPELSPRYGLSLQGLAIDPNYTLGELEARKREIRRRLQAEGLFGRNRALPAPFLCERVLVLAPPDAAGLGDFRAEADRLQAHGVCDFRYAHSVFQGETAPTHMVKALAEALAQAERDAWQPSVVAIIRGGGAVSDLAWLNDYGLARFVCELPVPVYCGIGHERDSTLVDEVAHTPFDTPSKVILGIEEQIERRCAEARAAWESVRNAAQSRLVLARQAVDAAERTLGTTARAMVADVRARVPALHHAVVEQARSQIHQASLGSQSLCQSIQADARQGLATAGLNTRVMQQQVAERATQALQQAQQRAESLMREIAGQGPEKTLARGWAIVRNAKGQVLADAQQAKGSPQIQIQLGNECFNATPENP